MGDEKGDRMTELYEFQDGTVANPNEVKTLTCQKMMRKHLK